MNDKKQGTFIEKHSKGLRKKGKRAKKEKGLPRTHKELGQGFAKDLRTIKGIFKCWQKAPKYILRMDANLGERMYVGKNKKLVTKRDEAIKFAIGFDREEDKVKFWQGELKIKLLVERL